MKIRIKGNSVRFRLTKTEVATFCQAGIYTETTHFNTQTFTYTLKAKETKEILECDFNGNAITMYLSHDEQSKWAKSYRVSYESVIKLSNGKELSLLLEKDFVCLDDRGEDESDNYPNPATKS